MILYLLYHKRSIEENVYNTKIIGIYSSYTKASNTVSNYLKLPGFSEFPRDFYIESFTVSNNEIRGFAHKKNRAFLLQYQCSANPDEDDEEVVISGIYPTKFAAILALRKIRRNMRRIRQIRTNCSTLHFYIDDYSIDEDNWAEGFVIITE